MRKKPLATRLTILVTLVMAAPWELSGPAWCRESPSRQAGPRTPRPTRPVAPARAQPGRAPLSVDPALLHRSPVLERYSLEVSGVWRGGPSLEAIGPWGPSSPQTAPGRAPGGAASAAGAARDRALVGEATLGGRRRPGSLPAAAAGTTPDWQRPPVELGRAARRGVEVGMVRGSTAGVLAPAPAREPTNRLVHLEGWKAFTETWDRMSRNGFRLIDVEATPVGTATIYSGLFTPGGGGYALISLPSWSAFVDHWVDSLGKGMELIDVEILHEGAATFFIGVYRARRVGQYMVRTASWDDFTRSFGEFHQGGFRLIDVETDVVGGARVFTGVWSQGTGGEYFFGLPDWAAFAAKWDELARQGYRLIDMEPFEDGGVNRYLGVWSQGDEPYAMWSGASVAAFQKVAADLESHAVHMIDFEVRPALGMKTATVWIPGYRAPQTVTYRDVIEGMYLIEGDVLVDPSWTPARKYETASADVRDGIGTAQQPLSSMATAHLWPLGLIPVEVSGELSDWCGTIWEQVQALDAQTNLTFYPRTTEEDYISFRKTDDGCHSTTGWDGGRRRIFLEPPGCINPRVVKHETMHAAGFHHEQIRDDRDDFVQILWDNVQDGKEHNFERKTGETFNQTPYDYFSIMHYFATTFGKGSPPAQTIMPTQPGVSAASLGGSDLSPLDIAGVNQAYAAVIPNDPSLFAGGPPVIAETTYDRCRQGSFVVGGKSVPKNDNGAGVIVPLVENRFSWSCDGSTEWTTCPDGTTHVRASRDSGGRIQWDCLVKAPAAGTQFLGTEIDRCGDDTLEIATTTGSAGIPDRQPQFVEVPDRRITWWCGGTEEKATLPPGTRFVRVLWDRDDDRRIEWQSFTAGLKSPCG